MPTIPNKPAYSHGSTGTAPSSPIDYANGDPVDQSEFDYYINTEFTKIKEIIDFLEALDADGDGKVDAADTADNVSNVTSTYKGNDIDSNGDGRVDAADVAQNAAGDFGLDGDLTTTDNEVLWDEANGYIPQARLEHDSVTVAGNTVSLSGSTAVAHGDLTNIGASDHHSKTSSASELTDVSPDSTSNAHHSRYSDSEARSAVDGANINISGDADTVDGFEIQKNGTDGSGIINFKT